MKNSIKISVATLALVSVFTFATNAQDNEPATTSKIRLSVGPDFALPIGDLNNHYDWGLGGSVQADFPVVGEKLFATANVGYLNFFKNDDFNNAYRSDLQLIPVKAGLKYFPIKNFYVQGEAGASFLTNKSDVGATNSATFIYAPQLGYQFNLGKSNAIDVGVRFEGNTKFTDNGTANNFFGLRLAYSFGL